MSKPKKTLWAMLLALASSTAAAEDFPGWKHLSTTTGDLSPPNPGKQQTSSIVLDIDKDGVNDFVITERSEAPSVVWYRRTPGGWIKGVIEDDPLHIEAGSCGADIDGDGDLDVVAGGDWQSREVWWWENPCPQLDPKAAWKRRLIKDTGATKHHDQLFGDFDGDGREELAFWNQAASALFLAEIPEDPRRSEPWNLQQIYSYGADDEPEQRGAPAGFKMVNEHEGLARADIDGDGKLDIVGGGRWFKHLGGERFLANIIDAGYSFSRAAAGDLRKGGRPEVVLVVGDGKGPLMWYEWVKGTWKSHAIAEVTDGHSLAIVDFDGDGNLDIFCAEMRLNGGNPDSQIRIFLGDGKGGFVPKVVARGYGSHESKMADLDGNGTLDVLSKPYNWETPRLDIFLNLAAPRERGDPPGK